MRILFALLLLGSTAAADPVVLRFASVAPEGTAWARELKAFSRDVEVQTDGAVKVKWYLGGIAGDETMTVERIRRGQLDGAAGALMCAQLAPSLWVTRVVGLFYNQDEPRPILNLLQPRWQAEFEKSGFVGLGVGNFGFEVIFSRTPVRTLADLRQQRTWVWNLDESWRQQLPALGIQTVPLPVEEAARAYDDGRLDAFIAIPTAALAYQWSARTPYFTDLKTAFLPGCVVIERRVLDTLSVAHQRSVRAAGAKLTARVEDVSRAQDGALVSAVFAHQGLKRVELTPAFTSAFYDAAHQVRDRVGPKLVSQALLTEVLGWLADLRAQREAR